MIDWGLFFFTSTLLIIGRPKAAVFPVPVWANDIKSWLFSRRNGIAFSWTGVAFSKLSSFNDLVILYIQVDKLDFSLKFLIDL